MGNTMVMYFLLVDKTKNISDRGPYLLLLK